jgi:assimilatory nitrate reductase catalytic subunit
LREIIALFPFASCVPFSNNAPLADAAGSERSGLLFRAASHEAPPDELLARIEALMGLQGGAVLRYADKKKGQQRSVKLLRGKDGHASLEAFMLAGDTSAQNWIKTLLQDELPAETYGRLLLSPSATPPVAVQSKGKQICSCLNVSEVAITAHLAQCPGSPEERLASLKGTLKCGTNCGSCVPELQRMVRASITTNEV